MFYKSSPVHVLQIHVLLIQSMFYKFNPCFTNRIQSMFYNMPGWTPLENYRTLEFTNLPSISPQSDFLRLMLFQVGVSNMLNLEICFGFMVLLSVALLDRRKL